MVSTQSLLHEPHRSRYPAADRFLFDLISLACAYTQGYSYGNDDGPIMCFNGPKSWQLGWFTDYHIDLSVAIGTSWTGNLVGFAQKANATLTDKMIIRIQSSVNDVYVNFNRKIGINSGTQEGGDQVLVTTRATGAGYALVVSCSEAEYQRNLHDRKFQWYLKHVAHHCKLDSDKHNPIQSKRHNRSCRRNSSPDQFAHECTNAGTHPIANSITNSSANSSADSIPNVCSDSITDSSANYCSPHWSTNSSTDPSTHSISNGSAD